MDLLFLVVVVVFSIDFVFIFIFVEEKALVSLDGHSGRKATTKTIKKIFKKLNHPYLLLVEHESEQVEEHQKQAKNK